MKTGLNLAMSCLKIETFSYFKDDFYSVMPPVSIHEYYVDNIITNMSLPLNLKYDTVGVAVVVDN